MRKFFSIGFFLLLFLSLLFLRLSMPVCALIFIWMLGIKILNFALPCRFVHWIHALSFEVFAIALIILLQAIGFFWKPEIRQRVSKKTPVLLVHGYINTSAVWIYLFWKLRREKGLGPIYRMNLKKPFASMLVYAKQVEKMADVIELKTGNPHLILVGHSMGGIVSSIYASRLAKPGKVEDVITIASPFHGTEATRIAIGKNAREMARGSKLLEGVRQDILHSKVRFSQIASMTDPFIIPQTSAILEKRGARTCIFSDLGHGSLLFSPRVAEQLIEWIR